MKYLLDTNSCIKFLNGQSENLRDRIEGNFAQGIAICSVVKAELLFGVEKSVRTDENFRRLENFCRKFISFPFDDSAATYYAKIRNLLEMQGRPIGPNDLMIAAIAQRNNLTIVTNNFAEFSRVEGLRVEDWTM